MWINRLEPSNKAEFKIGSSIEITSKISEDAGILYPKEERYAKSAEIISPTEYKIKCIFYENRSNIGKLQAAIEQGLLISSRIYTQNNPEKLPFSLEKYMKAVQQQHNDYARDNKYFWKRNKILAGEPIYMIVEIRGIRKWYTKNKEPFFMTFFRLKGDPDQENVFVSGEVRYILMEKYLE